MLLVSGKYLHDKVRDGDDQPSLAAGPLCWYVYPVLSLSLSSLLPLGTLLLPLPSFLLFLAASTAADREEGGRVSGLSQRAKEGLLLAQLSDLQRHMTRPELLCCQK